MVETQRLTSQQFVTQDSDYIHVAGAYTVTQDSNQWHDCHAGQPQQPGLAQRLPETDGAKVLPTFNQVLCWALYLWSQLRDIWHSWQQAMNTVKPLILAFESM